MLRWLTGRSIAKIDAERLRLAGPLEDGERPIEHLAGWALCGWPTPPLEGGPLDSRRQAMFVPADLLDTYLANPSIHFFGIRHLLVLALLTDRRLVLLPLDASRPAPRGQRYATYDQLSLVRRSAWLAAIEGVTFLGAANGILPDGGQAGMHLRVLTHAQVGPLLDGPPMPAFDLSQLQDVHELYGPEPGLLLTIAESSLPGLLDLLLGVEYVGIRMMESSLAWRPSAQLEEWLVDWKNDRKEPWRPLYERYP